MVYVEVNDPSAAAVAAQVTRIANDALHTAQAQPGVRARSGGVSTVPVYASNPPGKITGWRGRSELRLESADMRAMSDLLGKLQATMSVGYVNFLVSPEARRQAENELITQAIESFRARADIVRAAIGGKSVRIRHMAVVTGMSGPAPRPFIARAAAASVTPVEPPQFEAGESRVQATVTGTVEID
jgi:predicted secreted protein